MEHYNESWKAFIVDTRDNEEKNSTIGIINYA